MYRGRPQRGGYRPPEARGPPQRPYPAQGFRDHRPAYNQGPSYPPGPSYSPGPPLHQDRRRRYGSPGEKWSSGAQRERSLSPIDHNLVITVGNELTGPSGSAPSRHHDRDYAPRPEYERSRSRGRSRPGSRSPDRSRAKSLGRAKSRGRSISRSPDRSRAKSRGRSRSRSPDRSRAKSLGRAKSRGRSTSRSPDRSRGKSRGRSRSKSHSPDRSRAKSRGRSMSRPRSKSRTRGQSHGRSKSRPRSRSSSSSSSSGKSGKEFRELDSARRLKELQEMLSQPTKSILKRRQDSEDSPSLRTSDSPRGSHMSQVADQLLQAVKGMEPHLVASVLSELRSDPQMAQRIGLDAEIKEILHMLGGPAGAQDRTEDIDDEEKFLYGDAEDPKLPSEPVRPQGLDLYGDVTEDALYDDYPPSQEPVLPQTFGLPPGPHLHAPRAMGQVDERYRASVSPDQNLTGPEPPGPGERQALDEYEKIQDLLKTIGMDLGVTEISKMAARTKERLHGNKPPPKTPTRRQRKESSAEKTAAAAPPNIEPPLKTPGAPPPHPGAPSYPPAAQVQGIMPPNFPPPGFGQYGNYLPYMPGQWPPMYPPPTMAMPPNTSPEEFPPSLPYPNPYSTPPDHQGAQGVMKVKVGSQERKVSEEQNTESQKQKVSELLRKKRREKGGHRDPLLQEVSRLQEEVMSQISSLRREHESAEKKRNEIEKIALILGLIPSDRPRPPRPEDEAPPPQTPEKKKGREGGGSREGRGSPEAACSSLKQPAAPPPPNDPPEPFEYYDAGNHWCKNCNVTSGSMFDFYTHLHSKTHRKTLDPYDRPWSGTTGTTGTSKSLLTEEKLTKPAKGSAAGAWPGSEFLLPVRGFFCLLCKTFYGDSICAEEHVTKHAHNEKYKKQMYENPLYEQRRNLDRQAGLTSDAGGKKRKHEDEAGKDKEEKSKHKKDKKDKEKKKEEVLTEEKVKKEVEEKPGQKEEDLKTPKGLEEERPSFSKKDEEEEQVKGSKKEDKYRHRREEEDRYKYSREEEHRHRYDNRPKYGPRDEDFKHGKYPESRFRSDREEGKPKEPFKKPQPEKPAAKPEPKPEPIQEPPPKPYDPPKILCGPSPAMRAKLRKQSLEVGNQQPDLPL
ncbi:Zinc finger protein 318 [Dissostichus eleginoides]|uniref:Zinc finger protein 318 n=1 Tax=Dissostichus eleginoides TaxID=100907 RepID=A0AAD9CRJ2_DISEL|nr:Zinc finger protein 318 [Dissostichus eleginoides]